MGNLYDKYIVPPFSVLDTRSSNWFKLKKELLKLGIKSEIGRNSKGHNTFEDLKNRKNQTYVLKRILQVGGQSIFDPVLCKLMYRWFCPDNGNILDPFAGGSVRGIVANYLGYNYTGIDLRKEQIEGNLEQANKILPNNMPNWIIGDSDLELDNLKQEYDFVFTCPPYFNLEIYSDLEQDLSNMNDENFLIKYESIISKSCKLLKENRFACFVISDIRDKEGFYKDFISLTNNIFKKYDLKLYNSLILLNQIGSASLLCGCKMNNRKISRIHQNVQVYYKGNIKEIQNNFKKLNFNNIDDEFFK